MPTYEYRCKECGHQFEAVQSFTDDPITECPTCDGPVRKLFAAPGISFKGSGFYKTDSRSGSSKSSSSSSSSSSKSESKSESTSDSTSESSSSSGSSSSDGKSSSGTDTTKASA